MKNKKSRFLLIASICLILLAVISLGYALYTNLSVSRNLPSNMDMGNRTDSGEWSGGYPVGDMPEGVEGQVGEMPTDSQFSGDVTDMTVPEGFDTSQMPQGGDFQRGDGNGRSGGFNNSGTGVSRQTNWWAVGIFGAFVILSGLAGFFMLKEKIWAIILGLILSLILGALGLLSLFNAGGWLPIVISVLKTLLGIGAIVLIALSGACKISIKKKDIFDEEDYALYYGNDKENEEPKEEITDENADETESESA